MDTTHCIEMADLMKITGLARGTLVRLAEEGQIPTAIKAGQKWLFAHNVIEVWAAEQRKERRKTVQNH